MTSPRLRRSMSGVTRPARACAFALHRTAALRHRADGPTAYPRWHPAPQTAKNGRIFGDSGASDASSCSRSHLNKRLTFLTTHGGSPFTAAGLTNWFRECCNDAGLAKGTSAHGLRKAACRRLVEAGCSANVIAAISGHKSLNEVQRYTAAADQLRMARTGMEAMRKAFPVTTKRTSSYKPE